MGREAGVWSLPLLPTPRARGAVEELCEENRKRQAEKEEEREGQDRKAAARRA